MKKYNVAYLVLHWLGTDFAGTPCSYGPCVLQHELFGSDNHFGLGFCCIYCWVEESKNRAKGFIFKHSGFYKNPTHRYERLHRAIVVS